MVWPRTIVTLVRSCMLSGLLGLCPWMTHAAPLDEFNVTWDSPSVNHHGSMPLGNGDISLNTWVAEDGDLQFYIGKTDAWDDNARLLKVGKVRVHLEPNPFAGKSTFRQTLSLRDACAKLEAGEGTRRTSVQVWVDANHPVIHVTVDSAVPVEATALVDTWRTRPQELTELQISDALTNRIGADQKPATMVVEPDAVLTDQVGRVGWYHRNVKSVGPQLLAEVQGLTGFPQTDPLLHRTFGAMVTAVGGERVNDLCLRSSRGTSHRFSIFVLTRHPATPDHWLADMDELIRNVESQGFAIRRTAHERWWDSFWCQLDPRYVGPERGACRHLDRAVQRTPRACRQRPRRRQRVRRRIRTLESLCAAVAGRGGCCAVEVAAR